MKAEKLELQMSRSSDNNFYLEIKGVKSRLMMFRIKIPPEQIADLLSTRIIEVDSAVYSDKTDNWFKKAEHKTMQVSTVGYEVFSVKEFENWKEKEISKHEQNGWIADRLGGFNGYKYDNIKRTYEVIFRRWV